ncbi:glycosyltransferase family 2 protein [Metabacillus iocasae]|uniref:Cellulose synthase/poly-beta-1,6-N-acetylglucosamine synthase-like glycosyltransferase n=1 Tax=Priestia iocasae TaxID=2291674 RepID=A0ABS2QSN0_9BACI|nr:glycosyltransferase [Metabacillus iocasae]MBM7702395.1 cellulose synthase/poly-beta-1,6-N-acetylglucosamine synthase-like glycosyltransferase [Metabacillus iocasae]
MTNYVFSLSSILIWCMLIYHIGLMQGGFFHSLSFFRRSKTFKVVPDEALPTVSILIPAHNEEVVIYDTLIAMTKLYYPKNKLEIIVVNDNCSDETTPICQLLASRYSNIKVVETREPFKGKGKSSALNEGLQHSTGDVIVVYDADNMPEKYAVYHLAVALMKDPQAGAVVGKFRVVNATKNLLTRFINIETLCFQWMAQAGRWFWFKMCTIPGTNFAIRRSILESLGGWDVKALSEDTELSIRVYNLGYYIRFYPRAITWEQEPESWRVWWRQRTRWARGNLYVVVKYVKGFRNLEHKKVYIDLIYLFYTYVLFLVGVLLSNGLLIANLLFDLHLQHGGTMLTLMVLAFCIFLTQVSLALAIETNQLTVKNVLVLFLMYFTYSQIWILLVIHASFLEFKRMVFKQEIKWYKTARFEQKPQVEKERGVS